MKRVIGEVKKHEDITYRDVIVLWNKLSAIQGLNNKKVLIAVHMTKQEIKSIVDELRYPDGWILDKSLVQQLKEAKSNLEVKMKEAATVDGVVKTKIVDNGDDKIEILDLSHEESSRVIAEHDKEYKELYRKEAEWRKSYEETLDMVCSKKIHKYTISLDDVPEDQHNFMCVEDLLIK